MSEPQPKLLRQTCLACRQSKVKCDRASPACGRCVRLGIACIDSAPSRRGRGRSVGKKTAALQQLSGSALDSVKSGPDHTTRDIQDAATRGGAVSIEHVREWLLVALARDSSTLFARASLMASQGKLKLSEVFAVPTANGACCAARSECCAFHERLPPGNPFSRRFAAPAPVTPQLSPEHSPPPPASVELDPPAAKRARAGPIPGAPARAIRTDTRADDAAAQAAEALASSFPAALPNAAKALLKGAYNEAYAWFRVVVDGAIAFGASAAFDHKICSRQAMAAHFALNTTPVPSLSAAVQKPNAVDATMYTARRRSMAWADATRLIFTGTTTRRGSAATRTPSVGSTPSSGSSRAPRRGRNTSTVGRRCAGRC